MKYNQGARNRSCFNRKKTEDSKWIDKLKNLTIWVIIGVISILGLAIYNKKEKNCNSI